jgi:8-amino-7-oxononanoate synthase
VITESGAGTGVYRQVVQIVATRTLYDESYLLPESHFEGELGIDSVILESILATVKEHFGLRADLRTDVSTIGELAGAVEAELTATPRTPPRPAPGPTSGPTRRPAPGPAPERADGDALLDAVVETTMRHTLYQRHQLDLDAEFEGELGIDSVVLSSIVADVAQELGLDGGVPATVTAPTLRVLVDELRPYHRPTSGRTSRDAEREAREAQRRREREREEERRREAEAARRREAARRPRTGGDDGWDDRSMKDFMEQRDPDLFAKARGFAAYRAKREEERLYWYGMPLHSRCENRAVIYDELTGRKREFLMFASNNYLGLANHPKVIEAICDATRTYGATNTGCRIIGGTNHLHKELERRLAEFKQRPACIVFPGGYSANLGCISGLVKSYDAVIADKLNHMSIVDGARLSGAVRKIYRHNDMADLERVLDRCGDQVMGKLIVTDGVFSMHGDICDLPEINRLAKAYGARVLVDDAHATGVLGARGTGTAEHFGLKGEVDLELGTMSKTLAGMGGFVVGEEEVIDYLRFYANSYVFAATIPAGLAAGLIASIDVMESEPERLRTLWSNIRFLRSQLRDAGFDLEHTESAILPIVIGDERKTMEMGRAVRARGLFCQTVVFPGVPLGDARLRVSVTSEHTTEDLEEAAGIFVDAARETGVLASAGREPVLGGRGR